MAQPVDRPAALRRELGSGFSIVVTRDGVTVESEEDLGVASAWVSWETLDDLRKETSRV